MKHLSQLRDAVFLNRNSPKSVKGYVCIGSGTNPRVALADYYGIDRKDIYSTNHKKEFINNFRGINPGKVYFVTCRYYETYIEEKKIPVKIHPLTNLQELRQRIDNASKHKKHDGYVCVGLGTEAFDGMAGRHNIPYNELYTEAASFKLISNVVGNNESAPYYITQAFYQEHIKEDLNLKEIKMKDQYLSAQGQFIKFMGIKIGSIVKVIARSKDRERGWQNVWVDSMDKFIGKECKVKNINSAYGIEVSCGGDSAEFPFFVLFHVADPIVVPNNVRISSDYEVVFNEDASISVGCQNIPYEKFITIYENVQSVKKQLA